MIAILSIILLTLGYAEDRNAILEQTAPQIELSEEECIVDSILEVLREDALLQQDPHNLWVSQFFPAVREDYFATGLYDFLQDMPKGAVLHVHPSAMGDHRLLFDYVADSSYCYFNPITSAFRLFPDSTPGSEWQQVPQMLADAPDSAALRDSLFNLIVLDESDLKLPYIWVEFENIFNRVGGLFIDMDVVNYYYENAFYHYIAEENVQHIEFRGHRPSPAVVDYFLNMAESQEEKDLHVTIRMVYCDSRYLMPGETVEGFNTRILNSMKTAADLMAQYPGLVVGGDVYSQEDRGATAFYMAPLLEEAREYCMNRYGFELQYFLHDGESSYPTGVPDSPVSLTGPYPGSINNNVIDAYLLGAERVGHGIELAKLPRLAELYAEEGLPLEICPISNQILGYVPDLRDHPAVTLMRSGVRISINPDDPAMFQSNGVTADWMAAVLAWDLTLADLKQLILNSIEDAAMTNDERTDLMDRWQTEWDRFIQSWLPD